MSDPDERSSTDKADANEEWTGPVTEGTPLLDERIVTLENEHSGPVSPADAPIEVRVARLERIAEYLHDARREASTLANSVDVLAQATATLTTLLTAVEDQQERIESLGERVETTESVTQDLRDRVVRRAVVIGVSLVLVLALIGGGLLAYNQARRNDAVERCEARNEQAEILNDLLSGVLVGAEEGPRTEVIRTSLARFQALVVDCDEVV